MNNLLKSPVFLRWTRKAHLWIGFYMVAITLIWLLELLLLPYFYPPRLFALPQGLPETFTPNMGFVQSDSSGNPLRAGTSAILNYDFTSHQYTITADDCVSYMTVDGITGKISGPFSDQAALFDKYYALGWLHPRIQSLLRLPFELFFISLSITGFIIYFGKKKKVYTPKKILRKNTPYLFTGTSDENLKIRFASLGIHCGTYVNIIYLPKRGPLILEVCDSYIAFGGKVAETLKNALVPMDEETSAAS